MTAPTASDAATASRPEGPPVSDAAAAPAAAATGSADDLLLLYRDRITRLLVRFGDEILDVVAERRGVNVEDVREHLLGPLRD